MSSRPSLISLATLGVLGYVAYQAGRKTTEVFGADASPSEIERAMVENPCQLFLQSDWIVVIQAHYIVILKQERATHYATMQVV